MKETLQNIIFFDKDDMLDCYELYLKGEQRILMADGALSYLALPPCTTTDFSTYFNSCSYKKWRKYTECNSLSLILSISGCCIIKVFGFSLDGPNPKKTMLNKKKVNSKSLYELSIEIPENACMLIGFEIEALTESKLYSGRYVADFPYDNYTCLSLCSTTCRKEEYIKRNVANIAEKLIDSKLINNNLFIHVVDNGNTLNREDFPNNSEIFLHPNHNTGGAGGFARGMIESLHQKEDISHVLLMDDDVIVEPESIFRTYILLKHLLEPLKKMFVSGAMLHMERPAFQKEDVGYVSSSGVFYTWKPEYDNRILSNILENEKELPFFDNSYAAWWYCCIPLQTIKEKGLPLPLFVRGDDVEYGIRCNPGFITMNAICVWHMGFIGKFNVGMDHYQVNRNLLISKATSKILQNVNIISKIIRDFKHHIMRFDYNSAEIALRALEDYLKGPTFIMKDIGENILINNNKLANRYVPLETLGNPDWGLPSPYEDETTNYIRRIVYRLTWNGQIGWFFGYRKNITSVPFHDSYLPEKTAFRKRIIAVNVYERTGCFFERNNTKGRKLIKEYYYLLFLYKCKKKLLEKKYSEKNSLLISEDFWRQYLGI